MPSALRSDRAWRPWTWQWTPFRIGVVVLLIASFALRVWSVSRWTWVDDDWVYMERTRSKGFLEYLFQNYNGHLMPGEFLVQWVLTAVAPLAHGVAVILTAGMAAVSVGVWALALDELFGDRVRLLIPLAILALSPMMLRPTIWWASALQALPLQIFMGLCVLLAARFDRDLKRSTLIRLLISYVLALLFWEKALLLVVPIGAVLVFASGRALRAGIRVHRTAIAALGVTSGVYLALYVALIRLQPDGRDMGVSLSSRRSLGDALALFGQGAGDLLAPALLGGPWGTLPTDSDKYSGPVPVVVIACSVLLFCCCVGGLIVRRRAWIPLTMVGSFALVSWSLVLFSNRFDLMPGVAINDERYNVDVLAVACLGLAMLMTPAREEGNYSAFRRAEPHWVRSREVRVALVSAVAFSLVGANALALDRLGTHPGKQWLVNMAADVRRLEPVSVVDAYAPERVLFPAFWADSARLSHMLSTMPGSIEFDAPAETLYIASDEGHLQPVAIGDAAHSKSGPVAGCGYSVVPVGEQQMPMSRELYDYEWGMQVDTLSSEAGTLVVEVGGKSIEMKVKKGLRRTQAVFVGPVKDVRLRVAPGSGTICVTSLVVGSITAAPPG